MPIRYLFPTSPTATVSGGLNSATTYAVAFVPTAAVYVHRLRWYRGASGTASRIDGLTLWDTTTAGRVLEATSLPDDGTIGWQEIAVTTPVQLISGREYRMSGYWIGGNVRTMTYTTTTPTPGSSLSWASTVRRFLVGAYQYPTSTNANAEFQLVDLGVDDTAPDPGAGPGGAVGDVNNQLSDWLSSTSDNLHQTDGLPWRTDQTATAIKTVVDAINLIVSDAVTGNEFISTEVQATKILVDQVYAIVHDVPAGGMSLTEFLQKMSGAMWDAAAVFFNSAPARLTGTTGGGGSAFFSPDGRQVAASAAEAVDWGARQWHRTETSNWLTPVPGTDWVLENTLNWAAPFTWDQPADVYVMNITDYPATWDVQDIDGRLWLPRAAWWAPTTGDLTHERHFADIQLQVLHALPMRCTGMLFVPRPNFAGTMQAWRRPDP